MACRRLTTQCRPKTSQAKRLWSRVVQEASEQASSAGSRRTARQLRSLTQAQKRRPSSSYTKSNRGKALSLKADSACAEEIRAAVARTTEAFGTLDIFVSNAGILTVGTIEAYSLEEFDRMVAINVRAAFVGIQAA
jgi:NAD(P)-dependent dehydrogenase (short-subunit alcohol dehydrogenase family)